MDEEIQRLMEELIMRRTQEKDFRSLEDQIRCLRQRFDNLGNDHAENSKQLTNDESARERLITELSAKVDEMHFQRL